MTKQKFLCRCGIHTWSVVEPGSVHITYDKRSALGTKWSQIGTRHCMEQGCDEKQRLVRDGHYGSDGLVADTKWGWGKLEPAQVEKYPTYNDPHVLKRLTA